VSEPVLPPTAPVPAPNDVLETLVREGARKMLQAVLEEEVASGSSLDTENVFIHPDEHRPPERPTDYG
jgi:hypothetical protein